MEWSMFLEIKNSDVRHFDGYIVKMPRIILQNANLMARILEAAASL